MIKEFNQTLLLKAILAVVLSFLALALTWCFFWVVTSLVLYSFNLKTPLSTPLLIASGAVLFTFIVGWFQARSGRHHESFEDSGLFVDLEWVSGGTAAVDLAQKRISTWAYLIGQLCFSGPLQANKAMHLVSSRIPSEAQHECQLEILLGEIDAMKGWQPVHLFEGRLDDLKLLIRMDRIRFSPIKGLVRSKKTVD